MLASHTQKRSTPVPASVSSESFRHPFQTFTFGKYIWNIAELIRDIDSGRLRPKKDTVDRDFIAGYSEKILALDKKKGPVQKSMSILIGVNLADALALPPEALEEPIIFLETAKNKGILRAENSVEFNQLLGDGQHRIAKAYFEDVASLPAYVLSAVQSRKYRI